jgi:hypothetical protein
VLFRLCKYTVIEPRVARGVPLDHGPASPLTADTRAINTSV